MRIFGSEKIGSILTRLGLKRGEAIVHPWISKSLEKAQQRVEARNYEIRKNLLKFDNVVNEQRKVIYSQRIDIMKSTELLSTLKEIAKGVNESLVYQYIPKKSYKETWDIAGLEKVSQRVYGFHIEVRNIVNQDGSTENDIIALLNDEASKIINSKTNQYGEEIFSIGISNVFLHTLDQLWRDHLHALENLRSGISLRAYAQKDPLSEYKVEAFAMFENILNELDEMVMSRCMQLHITSEIDDDSLDDIKKLNLSHGNITKEQDVHAWGKVSRNELCPCGSNKKFKHCHGAV